MIECRFATIDADSDPGVGYIPNEVVISGTCEQPEDAYQNGL